MTRYRNDNLHSFKQFAWHKGKAPTEFGTITIDSGIFTIV